MRDHTFNLVECNVPHAGLQGRQCSPPRLFHLNHRLPHQILDGFVPEHPWARQYFLEGLELILCTLRRPTLLKAGISFGLRLLGPFFHRQPRESTFIYADTAV